MVTGEGKRVVTLDKGVRQKRNWVKTNNIEKYLEQKLNLLLNYQCIDQELTDVQRSRRLNIQDDCTYMVCTTYFLLTLSLFYFFFFLD